MLERWDQTEATDDIALLVSEVVTNAILHGGTLILLSLTLDGGRVRVTVEDGGAGVPVVRQSARDVPGGLGLHILEAIANTWDVDIYSDSKAVWFSIDCRQATANERASAPRPAGGTSRRG